MHPASQRQITLILDIFGQAPEVTAFDLGCLNHDTHRMSFRRTWTVPQVRKAFGWLAARNASGSSCYIRPAWTIARTRWVLVDGLTAAPLKRLSTAHPPAMVVRTAAGSFQAWMRLDEPVDISTRIDIARVLMRESGGDFDAMDRAQFGCLPGTTNRVPSSVREGRAAFVVLCSTSSAAITPIPDGAVRSDGPSHTGIGGYDERQAEVEPDNEHVGDRSDRDYAIVCRLLEVGANDHTIAATIAAVRGFDQTCQGDYIPRTIRAARRRITLRS